MEIKKDNFVKFCELVEWRKNLFPKNEQPRNSKLSKFNGTMVYDEGFDVRAKD